jgi:hypothetical protein
LQQHHAHDPHDLHAIRIHHGLLDLHGNHHMRFFHHERDAKTATSHSERRMLVLEPSTGDDLCPSS